MPRGANRVVNFKRDSRAIPGCTDQLDLFSNFVNDGDCDDATKGDWMKENCSLSCGTCDKWAIDYYTSLLLLLAGIWIHPSSVLVVKG
eukprot:scaffold18090_cov82-Skeletonema_dohrnii-CCMP3373.AAC.3